MISVIICTCDWQCLTRTIRNVADTIGCAFEVIVADNADGGMNIFRAYNESVVRARGNVVCFIHEDVMFNSSGWGNVLCDVLADESVGIAGVIGGHDFQKETPATWGQSRLISGHLTQWNMTETGEYYKYPVSTYKADFKDVIDVAVVDGLFMGCKKTLFNSVRFDETTFEGFHCYDYDICMQTLQIGKRVVVVSGIDLEHMSIGHENDEFRECLKKFHAKWNAYFPICRL